MVFPQIKVAPRNTGNGQKHEHHHRRNCNKTCTFVRCKLSKFLSFPNFKFSIWHEEDKRKRNYSMSPSWIWNDKITNERIARVGYNHFISNKGEWNNCFSKFSNRVFAADFYLQNFTKWKIFKLGALFSIWPGAIIGDGDRKRAPFLVLGLAPWYGTIFLFLEQIAPSPTAHARTCCEDFLRMSRKWPPRLTKFMLLVHNSTRLCLLEFGSSIFVVSCSSSEVRQCRI